MTYIPKKGDIVLCVDSDNLSRDPNKTWPLVAGQKYTVEESYYLSPKAKMYYKGFEAPAFETIIRIAEINCKVFSSRRFMKSV